MSQLETDDVVSLLDAFRDLEDPRSTVNRLHLLGDLIVISVLAVISGAGGPKGIAAWAKAHEEWLKQHLELPEGIPSHDTFGRLLAALMPAAFQQCFQRWIAGLRGTDDERAAAGGEIIAIDGKALRRSHDRQRKLGPLFLVSAWSVRGGISLGQLATAEKSNEITAIPELLEQLDVRGAIVTIDAAGCQKEIAAQIVAGEADYLLALKGNQETLHREVQDHVFEHLENDFADVTVRRHTEQTRAHGRIETRTYYQFPVPESLSQRAKWKGLRTIGVTMRVSEQQGQETCEVRYYISSLTLGVRRFAAAVRGHWGIENTLHWCLDVTFREDDSRLRNRHAANNLAWLNRFAISLLKQQTDKESVAMRRRMAGWNVDYLAQVVGLLKR